MIQEKQIQSKVLEEGTSKETIGMSLDLDSAQVLMQMLSKNLYSDPISSTVRECASNALDSHRRAGIADAIIVSLKINTSNNYEFAVEDFGTGLDADDVENIISKYGKSTKRESNTEIGMMGLGFKSPLAYCSSFYFTCRKDGIERKYMMYEGEDVNTIDLLYETPTKERNGVKIIVPVKINDRYTFLEKIKNQLAYFESVYFDVNINNDIIKNDFNIHRSTDFQLSDMNTDSHMHICLDNVYYPMDFAKLGITAIEIPVGLRFNLTDGLFPTPNREQLIYSSQAKKTILDKLAKVSDYFIDKYNENSISCDNIHEIFNYYSSSARKITIIKTVIDSKILQKFSTKQFKTPKYDNYKLTDFKHLYKVRDYMFYEYKISYNYTRNQFKEHSKSYWGVNLDYNKIKNHSKIWIYDELIVGNKKSYIKTLLPQNDYNSVYFIKRSRKFTLKSKDRNHTHDNYMTMLELNNYPKNSWRERIKEFQNILKELLSPIVVTDDIVIPQIWLDAKKKKRVVTSNGGTKRVKLQGEINCRLTTDLQRYVHGKNSKLSPHIIKMETLASDKKLYVYGKQKDEALFDKLFPISANQKLSYLILSDREHKIAQKLDIHNFITIEKFMEGKNKPFKRLVTSYLIYKLMNDYNDTFSKISLLTTVSAKLKEQLTELKNYKDKHYSSYCENEIYESMVAVSTHYNLFDETIYTEYCQVKKLLDTFPFIETTMEVLPHYSSNEGNQVYLQILIDLFKYHRIRIDYTNYKLVLNEDVILGEQITEETIDELTQNI